jgi:hypothetical protein
MSRKWIPAVFLLLSCSVIVGCGAKKDLDEAQGAVGVFHAQLDTENYAAIYSQADQRFRDASKQEEFLALMTAIHNKLGTIQSTERQGFNVFFNTSGTQVRVTYATKFTGGDAQEQFIWVKDGDSMRLLGYNINSNALIIK